MNIALLILILLTTLVIFMNRVSTTDVQISANEKALTTAFYAADAGAYGSAKFVGKAIEIGETPSFNAGNTDFPEVEFIVEDTNDFYDQVLGFDITDDDDDMKFGAVRGNEDIEFFLNGFEVNVGVRRDKAKNLIGGGAEFGSGSSGIGSGSAGGVAIYYEAVARQKGQRIPWRRLMSSIVKFLVQQGGYNHENISASYNYGVFRRWISRRHGWLFSSGTYRAGH